jgi:hypothetical protein
VLPREEHGPRYQAKYQADEHAASVIFGKYREALLVISGGMLRILVSSSHRMNLLIAAEDWKHSSLGNTDDE